MSEIKVAELDQLLAELASREGEKDEIEGKLKEKNKEIAALETRVRGYLVELERTEYDSPFGKIMVKPSWSIKMPETPEGKEELWAWMRERGLFDRYATVHAVSLKSLFKIERDQAVENGEDPVSFALPGMEPAKVFEIIDFKPKKRG